MSYWIERVRGHAIWQELDALGAAIDAGLARETISSDDILALERLRSVLTYYGRRIAATDPVLLPLAHLESVIANFRTVRTQVGAFTTNGDVSQLVAANGQADTIMQSLSSVPSAAAAEDLSGISEAAASYHKTLAGYLSDALNIQRELSRLSAENQAAIAQIRETLDAQKAQLATTLTDQQSQFSKAQDERASAFATSQAEQLGKFSQAMSEHQTQFSSDQDSRRTAFTDFERDNEAKVAKLISEYEAKLREHNDTFKQNEDALTTAHQTSLARLDKDFVAEGQEKLAEVERQKVAIEKLVGVIGNQGVTYGYQRQANIARGALYVWQGLTVTSLAGLIVVAFLMVFPGAAPSLQINHVSVSPIVASAGDTKASAAVPTPATGTTLAVDIGVGESAFYRGLAARIFLSLTFGVFAAYAARQASRFMAIEQKNRKMALELQALGPFLEPLPEDEQHKFRIQIGERSFGVPDDDHQKPKDEDPVTIPGLLKSKEFAQFISDRLGDAVKAFRPGG